LCRRTWTFNFRSYNQRQVSLDLLHSFRYEMRLIRLISFQTFVVEIQQACWLQTEDVQIIPKNIKILKEMWTYHYPIVRCWFFWHHLRIRWQPLSWYLNSSSSFDICKNAVNRAIFDFDYRTWSWLFCKLLKVDILDEVLRQAGTKKTTKRLYDYWEIYRNDENAMNYVI
jgi:hypothetical protein